MKKSTQSLIVAQMDRKLAVIAQLTKIEPPGSGWIHGIRTALKMSLRQLGERAGINPSSAKEFEQREALGTITIKSLREAAKAMDMKLVYGFVPIKGTLQKMLEDRAYEVAKSIVMRTSQSMKLEDQEVSKRGLERSVQELAEELKQELPRYLWDLK